MSIAIERPILGVEYLNNMNQFTLSEAERLVKLETQMDNIEKKVDIGFASLEQKLDSFIKASDEKYAPKWVEKAVWIVVTAGLGAVVVAVLRSISFE